MSIKLQLIAFHLIVLSTFTKGQNEHQLFISEESRKIYFNQYDEIINKWKVDKNDLFIHTNFGLTHVIHHPNPGKPALLLFHAAGLSAASWYANFDTLANHFQVIAIDLPGDAGKSILYDSTLSVSAYNSWILEILNHFNLEKAILCGHSIGGLIAANFAIDHPERIEKLILLAPAALFKNFKWYIRLALKLTGKPGKGPKAEKSLKMVAYKTFVPSPDLVNLMSSVRKYCYVKMIFPFKWHDADIQKITFPTLILFPENEIVYKSKKAYNRAVRLLPDAKIEMVPKCGHLIIIEKPDVVNEKIIHFSRGE